MTQWRIALPLMAAPHISQCLECCLGVWPANRMAFALAFTSLLLVSLICSWQASELHHRLRRPHRSTPQTSHRKPFLFADHGLVIAVFPVEKPARPASYQAKKLGARVKSLESPGSDSGSLQGVEGGSQGRTLRDCRIVASPRAGDMETNPGRSSESLPFVLEKGLCLLFRGTMAAAGLQHNPSVLIMTRSEEPPCIIPPSTGATEVALVNDAGN